MRASMCFFAYQLHVCMYVCIYVACNMYILFPVFPQNHVSHKRATKRTYRYCYSCYFFVIIWGTSRYHTSWWIYACMYGRYYSCYFLPWFEVVVSLVCVSFPATGLYFSVWLWINWRERVWTINKLAWTRADYRSSATFLLLIKTCLLWSRKKRCFSWAYPGFNF